MLIAGSAWAAVEFRRRQIPAKSSQIHQLLIRQRRGLLGTRGLDGAEPSLGAVLACNLSSPRRIKAGAARDHFLGFRAVSGRGEIFKAGGKVIKNVTGYDLPKLMAGSYGTLAARPETVATLLFTNIEPAAAGHLMTAALGSPHEVSGAAYLPKGVAVPGAPPEGDGIIALRLEGPAQSVEFRRDSLIREHVTDGVCETLSGSEAIAFWRAIGEAAPLSGLAGRAVWRISVAPARGAELGQEISRALLRALRSLRSATL
jgi:glycolate oxidase FAD binding subunit